MSSKSPEEITLTTALYTTMKVYSSSLESASDSFIHTAMFPDTCYGVESGGDPETSFC